MQTHSKIIKFLTIFILFVFFLSFSTRTVLAACGVVKTDPSPITTDTKSATLYIEVDGGTASSLSWYVEFECGFIWGKEKATILKDGKTISVTIKEGWQECKFFNGKHGVNVQDDKGNKVCSNVFYDVGTKDAKGSVTFDRPASCFAMGTQGLQTALGCIPTNDASSFVVWFLQFAIGIGGGIAFLLMVFGAFQIITSSGNPEKLKAGRETISSALMGLIMIIFSLFLLRLIGIDILKIPGL